MGDRTTHKVAIIGAGQLGSRHLQALAQIDVPVDVVVVEPSQASLECAQGRLEAIPDRRGLHSVSWIDSLDRAPAECDLAIVATTADTRRIVVQELLERRLTKTLVLEKVVFQSVADLAWAQAAFEAQGVRAWVNCPRRTWEIYQRIRECVRGNGGLFYSAFGGDWGLACNAIHFVDQAFYLAGCHDYTVDVSGLDAAVFESRRRGFLEVSGCLRGSFADGTQLLLYSRRQSAAPFLTAIVTGHHEILVDEAQGVARVATQDAGWRWEEWRFRVPLQSEQSHLFVKELLLTGGCALTPFQESCQQHGPLLTALGAFFRARAGIEADRCPIT